jgi:threonine dehydrogenase-like Zn-dependent dehydrogenase
MRAVGLDYEHRQLLAFESALPRVERDGQVLLRVIEVGVCGTDRGLASFEFGYPPEGESHLILGHEAVCEVVETGRAVTSLRRGDVVVPSVRRACSPPCPSCARGRRDLCVSGAYRERGIFGLHGYFADYAVDMAADLTGVPPELAGCAVLIEPLSVVEKAVETALRYHEPSPETALVLGAGSIGILSALALQARGLSVLVHSLEAPEHPRVRLVASAGVQYVPRLSDEKADIVIEATGSPAAALEALKRIAPLGVCCILGSPLDAEGLVPFRNLFEKNQTVFGSVNASPRSFAMAVEDLGRFDRNVLAGMIRRTRFSDFSETILGPQPSTPKTVHVL